jgi:DNA-binding PadR family transcriptional regulator
LVEENLIVESNNPGTGSYAITEKGKELLKRLKNVKEILSYDLSCKNFSPMHVSLNFSSFLSMSTCS